MFGRPVSVHSPFGFPMCSIANLEKLFPMVDLYSYGVIEQIQLVVFRVRGVGAAGDRYRKVDCRVVWG